MARGSADVQALTGLEQTVRWNASGPLGTPAVVTYSFSTRQPAYDTEVRKNFTAFSDAQKVHARQALDTWASVSGLTFIEVPEKAGGQIRFAMQDMSGMANATGGQVSGFAYYPPVYKSSTYVNGVLVGEEMRLFFDSLGGDVFMNVDMYEGNSNAMAPGQRGFQILLHEIGHAIGFKHPFEGTPVIDAAHNNGDYTVMAYDRSMSSSSIGPVDKEAVQLYYGRTDYQTSFNLKKLTLEIRGTSNANTIQGTELADTLYGLGGRDVLLGGPNNDRLFGGAGNDTLRGEEGDDLLIGGPGKDKLIGGEGIDTVSYADADKRVVVRLDNPKSNSGDAKGDSYESIEKFVGSRFADRIDGWTWQTNDISGGAGKDTLNGGKLNDRLSGDGGDDILSGGDGNDTLIGGNGRDTLTGGHGKDVLTGGKGADRFVFRTIDDSTVAKSGQDLIKDFRQAQNDKIVLKPIDANTLVRKNNAFTFIGDDRFSGSAGELRYQKSKGATFVYGDVDGDGRADFGIKLAGAITLTGDDFVL